MSQIQRSVSGAHVSRLISAFADITLTLSTGLRTLQQSSTLVKSCKNILGLFAWYNRPVSASRAGRHGIDLCTPHISSSVALHADSFPGPCPQQFLHVSCVFSRVSVHCACRSDSSVVDSLQSTHEEAIHATYEWYHGYLNLAISCRYIYIFLIVS